MKKALLFLVLTTAAVSQISSPLKEDSRIFIQLKNGQSQFEAGFNAYLNTASFTHLWLLESEKWRLKTGVTPRSQNTAKSS